MFVLDAPYDGVAEWTDAVSKSSAVSVSGPEWTCPGATNAMFSISLVSRFRLFGHSLRRCCCGYV